ncbi:MAG: ribonuclease P protein component [bacterium]|nr:ribonuclease P protein component [bacterium]
MIPSSRKVGKDLFETLMKKGRFYPSESFGARVFIDTFPVPARFSVVVAKKLEKSAVKRNTYKRRVYSLLQPFISRVSLGTVCVVFLKKKINRSDLLLFTVEVETFLKKSGLLRTQ